MTPVQFNAYIRRETGDEYRFIGYGQLLRDGETESKDICIMCSVVSGYEVGSRKHKKGPYHTLYYLVDPEDFSSFFDETSSNGELTQEAQLRAQREKEGIEDGE